MQMWVVTGKREWVCRVQLAVNLPTFHDQTSQAGRTSAVLSPTDFSAAINL
jgi:hypothetical protein